MKRLGMFLMFVLSMVMANYHAMAQEITIVLKPGCNWISYPNAEVMSIATALGDFTPAEGDIIKSQSKGAKYVNGQWKGTLKRFTPGIGYQYFSKRSSTVSFSFYSGVPQVTVTTATPTSVTTTSAVCGGSVTMNDQGHVFARGLCWSTHHNPTYDDNHTYDGTGTGSFSHTLEGLNPNTVYYVRAYVVSDGGLKYGNQKGFRTLEGAMYSIEVSANPSNGGTVSGGGTYNDGQSCIVIATAASGYRFVNWTENGNAVSTNSSYTFTVTSNRTLVAHFEPSTYAIGDLYPNADNPIGIVFYVYSNGTHGKIVSLQAATYPNNMYWDSRQIMYETGGTSSTNGMNNFNLMSYSYNPPKTWIVDNLGSGWYLPAYQELITLSNNIQTVNNTRTSNGFEALRAFFWSSTEYSAMPSCAYMVALTNDYYMGYSNGWYGYVTKNSNMHAVVGIKQF